MARVRTANALWLVAGFFLFVAIGPAQNTKSRAKQKPQSGPCNAARTQLELNQCFGEEFRKADAQLKNIYSRLVEHRQVAAVEKLKAAQKVWTQYRDLHCEAARDEYEGGSISPMVFAQCMTTTTRHRIEELNAAYERSQP